METIVSILTCNTIISILFDYIFKSTHIRRRHIKGINLLQILLSTIVAVSYLILFLLIIYEVNQNQLQRTSFFTDRLFIVTFVILVAMAFSGLGIHFATKVLSYHLPEKGEIVRINKYLHITLSHFLIYTSLILSLGNIAMYENIHPFDERLEPEHMFFLVILGILSGTFHGIGFARGRSLSLYYSVLALSIAGMIYKSSVGNFGSLPVSMFLFIVLLMISACLIVKNYILARNKVHSHDVPAYNY